MIKKYVDGLVNHPLRVILVVLAVTLFFAFQLQHLFMILDPKRILPQDHPFVQLNNKIEQTFGGSRVVVIGVVVKNGDVFNPATLAKIKRITEEVKGVSGILEENVVSISDRKIKYINASPGGMDIRPMMAEVPTTKEGLDDLKKSLYSNDLYLKSLISEDGKAAAIITDFRSGVFSPSNAASGSGGKGSGSNPWWNPDTGKSSSAGTTAGGANPWWNPDKAKKEGKTSPAKTSTTYDTLAGLVKGLIFGGSWSASGDNPYWTSDSTIYKKLHAIIDKEKDGNTEIYLGGLPIALSFLEADTNVMNQVVFPIAFVVIMGVLFLSFRSFQGMLIPILTALLSVIWALGLVGLLGIPLDPFTKTLTPLLIVAIAAGHSIQILKRYYEEYAKTGNHKEAVRESTLRMAPVMVTAGLVASASFASLITFHLKTFQAFGLLTAFGILSAVVLELSFIPAFRTMVPPRLTPDALLRSSYLDHILTSVGNFIPRNPMKILIAGGVILAVSSIGASQVKVNNSLKT
ncbi:MAG: MMPL family transporter, partial [Nitrospirae bacterium]|nr:MMPL family transporter [Nitrospirota bacterium]